MVNLCYRLFREDRFLGGTYAPAKVSEFVAIDIDLIGPGYDGSERKATICVLLPLTWRFPSATIWTAPMWMV